LRKRRSPSNNATAQSSETWLYYANQKGATHAFCERIAQRRARLPRLRALDRYNAPHPQQRRGIGYQSDRYIDAGVVDDALIA
jgi:hypothetical protein